MNLEMEYNSLVDKLVDKYPYLKDDPNLEKKNGRVNSYAKKLHKEK
jgi:hypothetical protein